MELPDLSELVALITSVPLFVLVFGARQAQKLVRAILGTVLIAAVAVIAVVSLGIIPAPGWYPL